MIWYLATYSISFPIPLPLTHCSPSTLARLTCLKHKKPISGSLYLLFSLLRNSLMAYSLPLGPCSNVTASERPSRTLPLKILCTIPCLTSFFLPNTCQYLTLYVITHCLSLPPECKSDETKILFQCHVPGTCSNSYYSQQTLNRHLLNK